MPLTPEQQELLSAYSDGEVNAAERALAGALLERPEARAYLEQLRALASRLREHGAAKAPIDLRQAVMANLEGDFDSISRPTSNQDSGGAGLPVRSQGDYDSISRPTSNQVSFAPQASWRMPLFAAAAAILVAAGVLFSGVMSYQPPAPPEVGMSPSGSKRTPSPATLPESAGKPAEMPPPKPENPATGGGGSSPAEDASKGSKPDEKVGKNKDRNHREPDRSPSDKGPGTEDDESDDGAAYVGETSFVESATEISICIRRDASVTGLYTEILSIGSLHGEAKLQVTRAAYSVASVGTDFTLYQGVEVCLEEERVPEFLAALERLTVGQGLGRVALPGYLRRSVAGELRYVDALQDVAEAIASGETPRPEDLERTRHGVDEENAPSFENYRKPSRASDPHARVAGATLPTEYQRTIVGRMQGEPTLAAPATKESTSRPSRVVRLMIRLQ